MDGGQKALRREPHRVEGKTLPAKASVSVLSPCDVPDTSALAVPTLKSARLMSARGEAEPKSSPPKRPSPCATRKTAKHTTENSPPGGRVGQKTQPPRAPSQAEKGKDGRGGHPPRRGEAKPRLNIKREACSLRELYVVRKGLPLWLPKRTARRGGNSPPPRKKPPKEGPLRHPSGAPTPTQRGLETCVGGDEWAHATFRLSWKQ